MGRDDEKQIKLVYVAGRYRAPTAHEREINIQEAYRWGCKVAAAGAYPIVPHCNTAHQDDLQTSEWWLAATLEAMRRCDAVLLFGDWDYSEGACGEMREALRLGLPVFATVWQLRRWLEYGKLPDTKFNDRLIQEAKR